MAHEAVVGLEVHAQLRTATKIFCGCRAAFGGEPNSRACPVCLGLPGALPVLNDRAVALAVRVAVATGCRIARRSVFARKNYFYPDVPKNYQITQYELPIAAGGSLELGGGGPARRIGITRIQLEEDAGKLLHDAAGEARTLIDLNRAGVPLLEIVCAPDLRCGEEAHACLTLLRRTLTWLDACDGNLEEGSLRCDANVSVRPRGAAGLGARVEIKNLNSFHAVWKAIDHEIARQAALLARGGRVTQQTRAWDADAGRTRPLRAKESADDYRYFPDPDLPPLVVTDEEVERARAELPELPAAREERLRREWNLTADAAALLCESRDLADYFEATARALGDGRAAGNWIRGEVLRVLGERGLAIAGFPVAPGALADLLRLLHAGALSGPGAKSVFAEMVATGEPAAAIIERRGLRLESDEAALAGEVERVLAAHPAEVASYLRGKATLLEFFVGQVVRATAGRSSPQAARRLVTDALDRRRR